MIATAVGASPASGGQDVTRVLLRVHWSECKMIGRRRKRVGLLIFSLAAASVASGCAPTLLGTPAVEPVLLADVRPAYATATSWDTGWGWFSNVRGPSRLAIVPKSRLDADYLREHAYAPPPERDLRAMAAACRLLALPADAASPRRAYVVLSAEPPVLGYSAYESRPRHVGPGRNSMLAEQDDAFLLSGNTAGLEIVGYVICRETFWLQSRRTGGDPAAAAAKLRGLIVEDVSLPSPERAASVVESAPWSAPSRDPR